MVRAKGCSEPFSKAQAILNKRVGSASFKGRTSLTVGFPCVRVPVLSTKIVLSFWACSKASALRNKMPARAPKPVPTIIAVGVAKPSAQGQAITNTDTAETRLHTTCPVTNQPNKNVSKASTTTVGTKTWDTLSAKRCTLALEPWACSTILTICASAVSAPTPVACTRSKPVVLRVPA